MRRILVVSTLTVMMIGLGACGGDDEEPTSTPSDEDTGAGLCASPNNQLRRPVAPSSISQRYGGQYPSHSGIDYAGPRGTPVRAVAAGRASTVQRLRTSYGFHVILSHSCGQTLYAHMSRISVNQGQQVKNGQIVGLRGSTGNSTGPHVHFEIRKNGNTVDPEPWVRNRGQGYGGFDPDGGQDLGEDLNPDTSDEPTTDATEESSE